MRAPNPKELYRHYKGGLYLVEDLVTHSEDESTMVLYRSLRANGRLFVRPLSMWFELIPELGVERFTKVED
ncbi:MAG: DUF1653 domain-containing protein [Bacteroidota bacterium]